MNLLVGIATYNECLNIKSLVSDIHNFMPSADILVLDDNSPDGTSQVVEEMQKSDNKLKLITRSGKLGLGTAHIRLMKYTIENKYDGLVTLDADFSHNPKYLPTMRKKLELNDFVIGSRYTEGGACDYGLYRTALSMTANFLARFLLNIPLKECTTAYRGYRTSLLKQLPLELITSDGYSFGIECIFYIIRLTDRVMEFPIHFEDRAAGMSKISRVEVFKSLLTLAKLFWCRFTGKNLISEASSNIRGV